MWITTRNHWLGVIAVTILFQIQSHRADDVSNEFDLYQTVKILDGYVRGKLNHTLYNDVPYYSFRGIPFGRPPVNELRFKPPHRAVPWTGTRDAFEYASDCIEPNMLTLQYHGQEDCLYLNVYVPAKVLNSTSHPKVPVMFYIYGGAYYAGSATNYGPDFLVERDVIIVTSNYRMGPLGFLSLNTPDYSGNMGLKDQLLALKWTNDNIGRFGGNVSQITIFGHSSGGACINSHLVSPASSGLFQRAIVMAGSIFNPWSYYEKSHVSILYNFAENVMYPVDNNRDLLELLRQINVTELSKKTFQNVFQNGLGRKVPHIIWAPVVEHPHTIDPFFSKSPIEIMTDDDYTSDVDTMFTFSEGEMADFMLDEMMHPEMLRTFDKHLEIHLPLKQAKLKFSSKEYKEIAKKIRNHYFEGKPIDSSTVNSLGALVSDVWIRYGVDVAAKIQANKSTGRTYFKSFSVHGDFNMMKLKADTYEADVDVNVATHGDEIPYLFYCHNYMFLPDELYWNKSEDSAERKAIRIITTLYTNFAKYGNPIPNREPLLFASNTSDQYNYIDLSNDGLKIKSNPNWEHVQFWDAIINDYSKHWQKKVFSFDSLAVKIPFAVLSFLLLSIILFKVIHVLIYGRKKGSSIAA